MSEPTLKASPITRSDYASVRSHLSSHTFGSISSSFLMRWCKEENRNYDMLGSCLRGLTYVDPETRFRGLFRFTIVDLIDHLDLKFNIIIVENQKGQGILAY